MRVIGLSNNNFNFFCSNLTVTARHVSTLNKHVIYLHSYFSLGG